MSGWPTLNIWPGQDEYDYHLQSGLVHEHRWLAENFKVVAESAPDILFPLEYNPKGSRNFSFLARSSDTLLSVKEIGPGNIGMTIDTGHFFTADENVSEAVVILQEYGKKFFHSAWNCCTGGKKPAMKAGFPGSISLHGRRKRRH